MKQSVALVVVAAVLLFVALCIAPLNEDRQLDFVNHATAAWLTIILCIPAIIAGVKVSISTYKSETKEAEASRNQRMLRNKF